MIAAGPPLPRTVVVGRGRLGVALAGALRRVGPAPRTLGGRQVRDRPGSLRSLLHGPEACGLVLLAVRDDALPSLVSGVAAGLGSRSYVATVLHLSGALGPEVLAPLAERGLATGSCHPLQTFTGSPGDADRFAGSVFAVDGSGAGREAAERLAVALGGRPFALPTGARPLYHLAASLGANGLTGLVAAARDALAATGLSPDAALAALGPLLRSALDEALRLGPEAALTGPVSRGDEATLARHRRALLGWDAARTALLEALVREQRRLAGRGVAPADAKMPRSD